MSNVNESYEIIKAGKEEMERLCYDLQTKDGSRIINKNSDTALATIYIVKELINRRGSFQTTRKEIEQATGSAKSSVNDAIKKLEVNGYITRYKSVKFNVNGTVSKRKGEVVYSQVDYMLVVNPKLMGYLDEKNIDYDFPNLDKIHAEGVKGTYKQTIITKYNAETGIWRTEVYRTEADGTRTLDITIPEEEFERAEEEARREYEEKMARIREEREMVGTVELPQTNPLVDREALVNADNVEFREESSQEEEIETDDFKEEEEFVVAEDDEPYIEEEEVEEQPVVPTRRRSMGGCGWSTSQPRQGYTMHYSSTPTKELPLTKEQIQKLLAIKVKIDSGEFNAENVTEKQITTIYNGWKTFNNGKVPASIVELYNTIVSGN